MKFSLRPLLLCALNGCELLDPVVCTTEARPAIVVTVMDSVTSGAVASSDVMIIASDGVIADTARIAHVPAQPGRVGLAHERAGRYDVEARAVGYITWSQDGVRVTEDECHVRTVELVARMQRLPPD